MTREIDEKWLVEQGRDDESKNIISKILELRNYVIQNNQFIHDKSYITVKIGNRDIQFRKDRSFSSIEVYYEIYKENEHFLHEFFRTNKSKVILDIGANEGYYLLKAKEYSPNATVICIEPNPYNFDLLQKNVKLNKLENVILLNKAVSGQNNTIELEIIEQIGNIGSFDIKAVKRKWMKDEFIKKIKVDAITLEEIIKIHDIEEIDILKIDVEGMEKRILEVSSDVLKKVKKIVVERHNKEMGDWIIEFLTSLNFDLIYDEDPKFTRYYADLYFEKSNKN